MKRQLMALLCLFCAATYATAQEPALPQPGPEHKLLAGTVGTWDYELKMEGAPETFKGTSVSKMDLGGLWLVTEVAGDFGGVKFHGKGLGGYDTGKQKFVSLWADSMSTAPVVLEGEYDAKAKTMTMTGEGPGMDGKPTKYKETTTYSDKDHQTFKMYQFNGDREALKMTIEYTRKK
ncbi:MAG: DUF1579 domain-containing protein [Planctomycetia bacterium]|nr:DUF1579 domain-containing protein [Planctomycetia bacterium]